MTTTTRKSPSAGAAAPEMADWVSYFESTAPNRAIPAIVEAVRIRAGAVLLVLTVFYPDGRVDSLTRVPHRTAATADAEGFWDFQQLMGAQGD